MVQEYGITNDRYLELRIDSNEFANFGLEMFPKKKSFHGLTYKRSLTYKNTCVEANKIEITEREVKVGEDSRLSDLIEEDFSGIRVNALKNGKLEMKVLLDYKNNTTSFLVADPRAIYVAKANMGDIRKLIEEEVIKPNGVNGAHITVESGGDLEKGLRGIPYLRAGLIEAEDYDGKLRTVLVTYALCGDGKYVALKDGARILTQDFRSEHTALVR